MESLGKIRVEPVLDSVVGSTSYLFSDVTPSVAVDQVEFNDLNVFLKGPLLLADIWVKVVVPTFPTLLANSAWQTFGYLGPVTWPMLEHKLD